MTRPTVVALLGLAVALIGCHPTVAERAVVRRWLLCEECTAGERDSVVALGDRVAKPLREGLEGPPASGREHIRRQAGAIYTRLRSPPPIPLQEFVGHYDSNYVANYQSHAAIALGLIGTPLARSILLEAVRNDTAYRDDVFRAIVTGAPISLALVGGDLQSAPIDSFVRINPVVVVRDSTSGLPLANVKVEFRVDSGGGRVADSVQRTGPTGLASRPWQLGSGADSVNVLRAVAAGRSLRFHATGRRLIPRLIFVVQPSNTTRGQPISPAPRVVALDAWDRRDSTVNGSAEVIILGIAQGIILPLTGGQLDISALRPLFPGAGVRLRVGLVGTTPATSQPFDVAP